MLHWKVNQPLGNFEIKKESQTVAQMGNDTGANVAKWTEVYYTHIATERQYHLLYFSTNSSATATDKVPKLTVRVNYTFTSKER
jgi:hypothetical protein